MKEKKIGRRNFLKTAAISTASIGVAHSSIARPGMAETIVEHAADPAAMPLKELGSTGVNIPILHLGTAQRLDPVYDKVMHLCFKEGVTYIDTAISYGWGSSHQAIANFMKQIGDRKQLWLTSKSHSGNPNRLIADLDQCLEELETDYLDLYLMHQINHTRMLDKEFLKAGDQLRKSGKT
ncbi:MAG: aldo/keto reductase, partial [Deltaproteobacteria bacterium]|nr:aldo/keto reductase [Deltaproteobacteria bacterium]